MRLLNNKLYIELTEMVACGVSENYLWKAKSTGTKCWKFIDDPDDRRKVLIDYEALKEQYRDKVIKHFGNPYDRVARQPILAMVQQDAAAHDYYRTYTYSKDGTETPLHPKTVAQYTRAASWLNMLIKMQARHIIKKELGLNIPDFYSHVAALMEAEKKHGQDKNYHAIEQLPGKFATSYQRLLERTEKYKTGGYDSLIDPGYGNKYAAKMGRTEGGFDPDLYRKQLAVIRKCAGLHTNFDSEQVTGFSNALFEQKGWPTLSSSTVYNIMQQYRPQLTPGRRGRRAYNNEIAKQLKRDRPPFPTSYFTLDGWTVELLYQDEKGYNNRLVVVVVLDAMNDYPVGYAIPDHIFRLEAAGDSIVSAIPVILLNCIYEVNKQLI